MLFFINLSKKSIDLKYLIEKKKKQRKNISYFQKLNVIVEKTHFVTIKTMKLNERNAGAALFLPEKLLCH